MKLDENEYRLDFFKEHNYVRNICKSCKTPFWSTDPKRTNCADIPCSDYDFLDLNVGKLNLSVSEARKTFLRFFEKNGHTIIPPKPVIARWRKDLYLTIASIVDFQPHVTSGLVPPPANPLVVSQPCIRLEDVDNVGITFGRHLTTFEMGGHHAFNYPDKFVYWKDKTVELAKQFFTEELKIPEELLTFKESWWEGGGNAGPSFEVTVGGLELATLVFMQYQIVNGEYVPLKLKIVDTGYGIERIAWFTQKTPTAFHAIYGNLVYTFFKKLGQDYVDEEMLKAAARFAGRIDPEKPETIKIHRELVAKSLGIKLEEVEKELLRAARVFQVLDHTKTISLMLADGLVPSNSGEGYLGRLLIRRALRVLKLLNSDIDLNELIKEQIEFWKEDFPQMQKNKDYILDAIENEQEKYKEILSKASSVAENLSKKSNIDTEDLVKIYDSNGIPPDIIAEELNKKGIKIDVPFNFYAIVAKRHQSAPIKGEKEKQKLPKDVIEFAKKFDATDKLYYKDQYQRSFTAKVLGAYKNYLILDKTVFYPEGGGQLGDTGIIKTKNDEAKVIDTQKVDDVVVHILDKEIKINEGEEVYGEIDWQRRYRLMKHHTGTHVILAAAKKLLGEHVWQAGAEKTPEKARLDITHYKMLTQEEIKELEDMCNYVINDRRSVRAIELDRMKAEMTYGVSIYEGGVVNKPIIRLLEIKDWDVESCGGTHVSNTSEIGSIKIINVEKIQDGIIRLEYVAGDMVSKYARDLEDKLQGISKDLNTSVDQLEPRVKRTLQDMNKMKEELEQYRKLFEEYAEKQTIVEKIDGTDITLKILPAEIKDNEIIKDLLKKLTLNAEKTYVISIKDNIVDIACSKDMKVDNIIAMLRTKGGKGGGKGTFGSINIADKNREEIINDIKQEIKRSIH
ncbi:alanine--tRNA ligase [Acidianus sulfidivorans JP7]|uniref:alanine--tRNA ligase n=1 Tax=Acidianus sulfidivorans TaxID=312539 RepID=UPI001443823F|nr:alanine--tRNA ligase [Acidianus sulfidivorans]QIJ32891.1 alanine--tRNA ligase [Acidianus sulfidivorans JP7]